MMDYEELMEFAGELADSSGAVIRGHFRSGLNVERKADESPVTEADRAAERALRELIEARFPDHGIYGEEYGKQLGRQYTWVLDPIDGTKSFINGMPTFGTLIALMENANPVLGVIDAPALAERWIACEGRPTQFNGADCRTRKCQELADASLLCTSIDMFEGEHLDRFQAISSRVGMRRYGGDCYAYGLLALGCVDLVIEATMEPYDYLALVSVVEQAGGAITDWQGGKLSFDNDGTVLAAGSSELHSLALAMLRG